MSAVWSGFTNFYYFVNQTVLLREQCLHLTQYSVKARSNIIVTQKSLSSETLGLDDHLKAESPICAESASTSHKVIHSSSNSSAASSVSDSTGLSHDSEPQNSATRSSDHVGEMRVRLWYSLDEVLPLCHYQPLYVALLESLQQENYRLSLISLMQELPIDMEAIARPLMKVFVHAKEIRKFFRIICADYLSGCHDVNTLFRSQSMASRVMYEMMKFVGRDYLLISLKPLIDLIYAERKCCEIDPAKLKPGDNADQNLMNIMLYAELAFSRVVDSHYRCPTILSEVFAELRAVVGDFFPGREDIGRLALSSFLIMRFFAAAILNPKLFGLKREAPEANVSRTLVLISKVLQRLANCVVSQNPLTTKETWLTPVLERLSDDAHKTAMIRFLDSVSNYESRGTDRPPSLNSSLSTNTVLSSPLISEAPLLLKAGHMVERRTGADKKRSFKNLIHQKRRFVTLSETELTWQKMKESGNTNELEPKGSFALTDIISVIPLADSKHSFCVATSVTEVHFQAASLSDMNEWMILIQKQQRRHMMHSTRPLNGADHLLDINMEEELELIHSMLKQNTEILASWKTALNEQLTDRPQTQSLTVSLEKLIQITPEEQSDIRRKLLKTVTTAMEVTQQIQVAHKTASSPDLKALGEPEGEILTIEAAASPLASPTVMLSRALDAAKFRNGSHPTTPTTPTAPLNPLSNMVVDSENYLHLRTGGACKRVRQSAPHSLYDSKSQLSASLGSLGPPPKSPTA